MDFHRDIEPILREHCIKCHGPKKQKGKLRLDTRELALKGGDNGEVIVPGQSKLSVLYTLLIAEDPDDRMPTKADPIPPEHIRLIRNWIDAGAEWPDGGSGSKDQ